MGYREEAIKPSTNLCQVKCDAYIATKNNDQALREKTAKLWAELNNAPILPEHISCEGCRMDGTKTVFCSSLCEIRKCAVAKGIRPISGPRISANTRMVLAARA